MLKRIGRAIAGWVVRIGPLRNGLRRLSKSGLLPQAVWQRLPAPSEFTVELESGASFRYQAREGDLTARPLFWRGTSGVEVETMSEFINAVMGARFVVDVGANTGVYSLVALASNESIRVLSIEALPRVSVLLQCNLECNSWSDRADVVVAAAAAHEGTASFVDPAREIPVSARLVSAKYRGSVGPSQIQVSTVTLDLLVGDVPVDVIKIDVEGAEDQVLAGARRILERDRPVIFFECHAEGPLQELEAILEETGYLITHLRRTGPVRVNTIIADPDRRFPNFMATPRINVSG